ncbi:16S rRNA (cytosine(1402)-N(4))-methyltransferase [Curtobacterium flaccumfaciens]|nr:16S rRNA (cytosine(1402)-N(4))-methyltransferase [Curtobacterium flaccumfaciens]
MAEQTEPGRFPHTPVMLERTVDLFTPTLEGPGKVVVDATLGMGGHSAGLLERFPELTLIGLDRDTDALGIAGSGSPGSVTASAWCTPCTTASPRRSRTKGSTRSTACCSTSG